jgi:probable rRNA maturation factor
MNTNENQIRFFTEDILFILRNKKLIRDWLEKCARKETNKPLLLNYIFCSDPYLKKINKKFLSHNYLTDIITFPSNNSKENLSGDIFISIDRVRDNARNYNENLTDELHRVMVHGLLHLCGYRDKTQKDISLMRKKENSYLKQRSKLLL